MQASDRSHALDLQDLEGQLGCASLANQMAQLRGMGFVDETVMRQALVGAGEDVAAAVELLHQDR